VLKAIKASLNEYRHYYQHTNNATPIASNNKRSTFFKTRSLSILFKLQKVPRAELKKMCEVFRIKYINLIYNILIYHIAAGDFRRRKFSDSRKRLQTPCRTSKERIPPEYKEISRHVKIFEMGGGIGLDLISLVRFLK
jgi:hypothetical protein